jgi:hypothetical protein
VPAFAAVPLRRGKPVAICTRSVRLQPDLRWRERLQGIELRCGLDEESVPPATPLDHLEAGQPLSEFLEDFPTVTREQAVAALEQAKEALLARARPA